MFFKRYIKGDPKLKKEIAFYLFGTKCWYLNNKKHREDGPAIEYTSGIKDWFLNGESFLEKDYWIALEEYKR